MSRWFAGSLGILFCLGVSLAHAGEGHDAGREWAEMHDITDTDYNNGKSESFNEGVREYAEERQAEMAEEESSYENDANGEGY